MVAKTVAKKAAKKKVAKKKAGTAIAASAVALAGQSISAIKIWERIRSILGLVTSDSSTVDHIGNAQAVAAFADVLNRFAAFRADGLALTPGDLRGCMTLGCIVTAIIRWYQRNGWRVFV
jgi:hypothetical protein